jgi:hypothetical protein
MITRMFSVTAHWDDEVKIFYSDSDIIGLHIEARTIDEFESVMMEVAPGLVIANHVGKVIPAILWQRPTGKAA